ncbi:MAG: glycerophosphodiester phosphodiesterase family protein [Beijerinckiaceae bacterium]
MSLDSAARHWLVARPIAHRGLHTKSRGLDHDELVRDAGGKPVPTFPHPALVENSLAAAAAAMGKTYAIECDVQMTKDGEAFVFHDETLDRLTLAHARARDLTAHEITQITYRDGEGTIPLFTDFLSAVAGRVPLIVEIKSRFEGDMRLATRVAALIADYSGPLALQSFDPAVLVHFRNSAPARPLGLIAQAGYGEAEWPDLSDETRRALTTFSDYAQARPDFLAWNLADLPHAVAMLWRTGMGLPLLTWTVRDVTQADLAARFADQMIFEGFEP